MDPFTISKDIVIDICHRSCDNQILSDRLCGRKVIALTDQVVVKFGLGVTIQEARAQQLAIEKIDSRILRIPQVYRFFTRPESSHRDIGYLVMERIDGVSLEYMNWDEPNILSRVITAINAINSIPGNQPGPISGGESNGSLWSEYGSGTDFHHVRDLESYLNKRLDFFRNTINIREDELRLCHMDIAPRNFMVDLQGRLCLLDWATAGFFPRYFELWSIEFAWHTMGNSFELRLLQELAATSEEKSGVQKLWEVYRYNSHFAMNTTSDETESIMAAVMASNF